MTFLALPRALSRLQNMPKTLQNTLLVPRGVFFPTFWTHEYWLQFLLLFNKWISSHGVTKIPQNWRTLSRFSHNIWCFGSSSSPQPQGFSPYSLGDCLCKFNGRLPPSLLVLLVYLGGGLRGWLDWWPTSLIGNWLEWQRSVEEVWGDG